jgi:spore germination protein YaaH
MSRPRRAGRSALGRIVARLLAAALALAAGGAMPAAARAPRPEAVGFYVPWDPQAKASLGQHLDQITVFAPQWINITDTAGAFTLLADPAALDLLAKAAHPPRVMPLVTNAHDGVWDVKAADAVLLDPNVRASLVAGLAVAAEGHGFAGYILDLENLSPAGQAAYPALAAALKAALAPGHGQVWVTTELYAAPAELKALAAASDAVLLMAYDQCWATSLPGPVAGVDWIAAGLAARRDAILGGRAVVALGSYAYDWLDGGPAKVLAVPAALAIAQAKGAAVTRDAASLNARFDYVDEAGHAHHVWLADGPAVAGARIAVARFGARGWGLWRLGLEDPAAWDAPAGAPVAPPPVAPPPLLPSGAKPPAACEPLPH